MSSRDLSNREFEPPKWYKFSGLFIVIGLIMLHWSQSIYFVAGNLARLGSLAMGFGLIVLAVVMRSRGMVLKYIPMALLSGAYFVCLVLLTKAQGHMIWYEPTQQIFCVICLVLFWSGFILAQEKRYDFVDAKQWSLIAVAVLALFALLAFTRYVQAISFHGSARGFGETTLNPVGVAFANSCLGLIFLMLGILSKEIWRKVLFLIVGALAFFVVLSSASRGAVIWATGSLLFFLVLNRHRRYFSPRAVLFALIFVALVTPLLIALYKTNYGVAERIDVLGRRFESMFRQLFASSSVVEDGSIDVRGYMWNFYLQNWHEWILIGEKGYTGYPHNQWLEIGARFGLLGIPMFLGSVYIFGRLIFSVVTRRAVRPDLEYSIVATLFVFGYLQSMTSLSLQVNRVLWLGFGYLLGSYLVRRPRAVVVRR